MKLIAHRGNTNGPNKQSENTIDQIDECIKNGYDVEINSPDGGVLILNTTALPFWQARGDGKPLQIVEANLIQIAVSVPPGVKNVTFRYHRPTLFDAATRFKQSMFSTGNT